MGRRECGILSTETEVNIVRRWKQIGLRMLYPHPAVLLLMIVVSAVALAWVFACGMEESVIAYAAYPLSAYALMTAVVRAVPMTGQAKRFVQNNRYTAPIVQNREYRAWLSLRVGLGINLAYAAFKLSMGVYFWSAWFGATAVYYMVLCVIRFLLVRGDHAIAQMQDDDRRQKRAMAGYRQCGWLILLLNIAMTGMIVQMVWHDEAFRYPGVMIYASAAYTFYRLVTAIVSMVRFRRAENPLFAAAKSIDMCVALMSLYALQSAMIVTFGESERFRLIMNSITGFAVAIGVIGIAGYMLLRSKRGRS